MTIFYYAVIILLDSNYLFIMYLYNGATADYEVCFGGLLNIINEKHVGVKKYIPNLFYILAT